MDKILFINACVRPNSRTLELAHHVLDKSSGEVQEVKLYSENLAPLELSEIELRDKAFKDNDFSSSAFDLAKQFANAQTIVIAAPYWDLTFPAVLKCYFEKITVNGLTFCYGEKGAIQGLCKAKKLVYVTTAGGPIIYDFGYNYVATLAKNFYGISDIKCLKAEGLDVYGANVAKIMEEAKQLLP